MPTLYTIICFVGFQLAIFFLPINAFFNLTVFIRDLNEVEILLIDLSFVTYGETTTTSTTIFMQQREQELQSSWTSNSLCNGLFLLK